MELCGGRQVAATVEGIVDVIVSRKDVTGGYPEGVVVGLLPGRREQRVACGWRRHGS